MIDTEVADILDAAADLISPKKAWGQGAFARTADGIPCNSLNPAAAQYCMLGAIARAAHDAHSKKTVEARGALEDHVGISDIPLWQDRVRRTKTQVIAALRGAAANCRGPQ
jgi:hypothetical protein